MEQLVAKLPTSKRVDWARHAASIKPFPTLAHFSAWLQEYAKVVWFWTSMERSLGVEFCMRASTRTDAIIRIVGFLPKSGFAERGFLGASSAEPVAIVAAISTEQIGLRRSEYVKISFRTDFIEHGSGFIYMIWSYKDVYLGLV